jgi:hypothetical protein
MEITQSPPITLPPSLVGTYELTRKLTEGGMGIIWLARDRANDREVVFKFIAPELLGDDETQARFINEAKLTAKLDHPNIVKLYSAGQEAGLFYIIYEYLEGHNLKTYMEKYGKYPIGKALEILVPVCEAIAYAHMHKILHRDIKPENILMSPLGDKIKILDFGIAKSMEDSQKLTQTGFIIGTPEYLSPEQAVGHKASFHSDQYALAVLAYELLTARLPIEDQNTVDLFTKKIRGAGVPIRQRRPEIPAELARIIEKAMATEAPNRFASVDDMVRELKEFSGRRTSPGAVRTGRTLPGAAAGAGGAGGTPGSSPTGTSSRPSAPSRATGGTGATVRTTASGASGVRTTALMNALRRGLFVLAGIAGVVAAVAGGAWWLATRPESARVPVLAQPPGTLGIVHQIDGVAVTWEIAGGGQPVVRLVPGGREKPMQKGEVPPAASGDRFGVHLSPGDLGAVTGLDLVVRQGNRVETEVKGLPLLSVAVGLGSVTITVPPLDAGAGAALAVWPAGREHEKKEIALKSKGASFAPETIPIDSGQDLFAQVVGPADGARREPLTQAQKIQTVGSYVERLEDRLARLEPLKVLGGQVESPGEGVGTAEWLDRSARKLLAAAQAQLASAVEVGERFKEMVAALEPGRRFGLYTRLRQLELLVEMARRAGFTSKVTELEDLMGIPWPVEVKHVGFKAQTGKPKAPEKNRARLMETTALSQYRTGPLKKSEMQRATLQIPSILFGIGTYLKVSLNRKTVLYLWGPAPLPPGTMALGGALEVKLDGALLADGVNQLEIETQPVAGLVQVLAEWVVAPPKLRITTGAGEVDVPLTSDER